MRFCPCASTSNVPGSPGRNPHFSPRRLVQSLTAGAAQWGLRAGPTRGRGEPWSDPSKWGGLDSQAGEPCPGPGPTPPCVCLLPQCEQFVEQHAPQLQTLMSGGWDAHTACQVHPPFPADPGTFLSSQDLHPLRSTVLKGPIPPGAGQPQEHRPPTGTCPRMFYDRKGSLREVERKPQKNEKEAYGKGEGSFKECGVMCILGWGVFTEQCVLDGRVPSENLGASIPPPPALNPEGLWLREWPKESTRSHPELPPGGRWSESRPFQEEIP